MISKILFTLFTYAFMFSYQLSKQLEPDDLPSSLYVPESSLSSLSPARIRRALRHVFNSKGNIVSDLSPSPPLQRATRSRLTPSLSEKNLLSTIDGRERRGDEICTHITNTLVIEDPRKERALSLSPERTRSRKLSAPEIPLGHVIRVSFTNHDHCNYVSLLVSSPIHAVTLANTVKPLVRGTT